MARSLNTPEARAKSLIGSLAACYSTLTQASPLASSLAPALEEVKWLQPGLQAHIDQFRSFLLSTIQGLDSHLQPPG